MFVTFESVKSGVPIELQHPIDNKNSDLNVILHEIFYTVKWLNISHDLNNNWIMINKKGTLFMPAIMTSADLLKNYFGPDLARKSPLDLKQQ